MFSKNYQKYFDFFNLKSLNLIHPAKYYLIKTAIFDQLEYPQKTQITKLKYSLTYYKIHWNSEVLNQTFRNSDCLLYINIFHSLNPKILFYRLILYFLNFRLNL